MSITKKPAGHTQPPARSRTPSSPLNPSTTHPLWEIVKAPTAKCEVCGLRNRGGMLRCRKCVWQTCHSDCASDPRCVHGCNERTGDHRCCHPELPHKSAKKVVPQERSHGRGKKNERRFPALALALTPAPTLTTTSVGSTAGSVEECTRSRKKRDVRSRVERASVVSGSGSTLVGRTSMEHNADKDSPYHNKPAAVRRRYTIDELIGARDLCLFSYAGWLDHVLEREYGHRVEKQRGNGLRKTIALPGDRGRENIRKAKRPRYIELTETDEEYGEDDDSVGDDDYHDDDGDYGSSGRDAKSRTRREKGERRRK
ncbi:hypothetical protein BJX61DRAFT_412136 [Aspergillus egyptiacus]|nr:hypothetical protein BJX61DRAFT_412136 [Aspergillus egyptiacus]